MKQILFAFLLAICLFLMMRQPVIDDQKDIKAREDKHYRNAWNELYRQADALLFNFVVIK